MTEQSASHLRAPQMPSGAVTDGVGSDGPEFSARIGCASAASQGERGRGWNRYGAGLGPCAPLGHA